MIGCGLTYRSTTCKPKFYALNELMNMEIAM